MAAQLPVHDCKAEIPYAALTCTLCGLPVGFPNVRAAESPEEVDALAARVADAVTSADARRCRTELEDFGDAVQSSVVVVAMQLTPLQTIVENDNALQSTYHNMVAAGARLPNNGFDNQRQMFDSSVNPHDVFRYISYGALSIDGEGVDGYGPFSLTLRELFVDKRSSVFEENPATFFDNHGIAMQNGVPLGYRATWQNRSSLAMAKLQSEISSVTKRVDYPNILLKHAAGSTTSDFIEVHMFGAIPGKAVSAVSAKPPTGPDRVVWRRVKAKLIAAGVGVKER